jgi:DNA ligase-1
MLMTINTGKSVFEAIEAIAATSSKLEKEALMKQAGTSSTLFMKAVTYAYDPFKNYGISYAPLKSPGLAPGSNTLAEPVVWTTLDDLVSRNLSGNSARDKIQQMVDFLDEPSAEVFRRIINKDMRAGFTDGTINRVFKGTIAEFPYMRCSLPAKSNMGKWDWSVGIVSQEKADGMFANVNMDVKGYVWITSRQGSPFPAGCLGIEENIAKVMTGGTQTHGELTVYEAGVLMPREKGNGVLNSLLSGGDLEADQKVVFDAWDQIPLQMVVPRGNYPCAYKVRLRNLLMQTQVAQRMGIVNIRTIPTRIVKSKGEAYAHYRELLKKGKEGTICKHPDAYWKDTTSKDQVKLKLEVTVELIIKGFIEGAPGTKTAATFGSLLCGSGCDKLEVGVSGITDAMRQTINDNRENWLETIVAVTANSIMSPDLEDADEGKYSLFLPRVAEFRKDKHTADTLEQIKEQFEAAVEGA